MTKIEHSQKNRENDDTTSSKRMRSIMARKAGKMTTPLAVERRVPVHVHVVDIHVRERG